LEKRVSCLKEIPIQRLYKGNQENTFLYFLYNLSNATYLHKFS
jgi:hypothetical protein